jgi:hypothetical protein
MFIFYEPVCIGCASVAHTIPSPPPSPLPPHERSRENSVPCHPTGPQQAGAGSSQQSASLSAPARSPHSAALQPAGAGSARLPGGGPRSANAVLAHRTYGQCAHDMRVSYFWRQTIHARILQYIQTSTCWFTDSVALLGPIAVATSLAPDCRAESLLIRPGLRISNVQSLQAVSPPLASS